MSAIGTLALAVGTGCAACAGYQVWRAFEKWRRRARHREAVHGRGAGAVGSATSDGGGNRIDARVIALMERMSMRAMLGRVRGRDADARAPSGVDTVERDIVFAGLSGRVSPKGFREARARLAVCGCAAGGIFGAALSWELACLLALVGAVAGYRMPASALKRRTEARANGMERHLPEMLDVVAIGMRSGLSFDRSLEIYETRFPTMLAGEFASAQRRWASGLERRDEALRQIARSYDSPIFTRVIESVIRSLRFGSSMVEGLEAAAREARIAYRTRRQEQVAKAPVKMMVPTGTLILPAMLILVLGPVLLELAGGGA